MLGDAWQIFQFFVCVFLIFVSLMFPFNKFRVYIELSGARALESGYNLGSGQCLDLFFATVDFGLEFMMLMLRFPESRLCPVAQSHRYLNPSYVILSKGAMA